MPDPATIDRLRSSVLSAVALKELQPDWSDAVIDEWLNFLDNFIKIAEILDLEIDKKVEELDTDFTDGSIPYADSGHLTEDNVNLAWDDVNDLLEVLSVKITGLTTSRLLALDSNGIAENTDIDDWLTGTVNQVTVTDDADGTATLSTPQDIDTDADVEFDSLTTEKIILDLVANPLCSEGHMAWDADNGTVRVGMLGGNVCLQVGQEGLIRVRNSSGSDIANGKLVYATGASGNKLTIDIADNTDSDTIQILGMATEDIDNNQNGFVALWGTVRGATAQPIDTSTFSEGDKLYLSTSGDWTGTHPTTAAYATIIIGIVQRQHASEGEISLQFNYFTIGNSFNGTMRQSVINKNTGNAAGASFTAVNDQGYRTSLSIFGNSHTTLPNVAGLYNEGYGETAYVTDGNEDHAWYTDPTDAHNFSALSNEVMRLVAAGHLKLVKDNSKLYWGAADDASIYYDGTDLNIKTDEVAASDLLLDCGAEKTLELQTVVYDDLQVSISNIRVPASSAPAERLYDHGIGSGVTFPVLGFDTGEYIYFDIQTYHAMKLSTVLDNHIHYMTPTDGTGDRFQFQLDVIAAPINGNWAVPTGSPYTKEVTMAADLSNTHKLVDIADIPAVNTTVSTIYKCKLTRIAATTDEYSGEVYLEFTDCHYQKNTMGSRAEAVK